MWAVQTATQKITKDLVTVTIGLIQVYKNCHHVTRVLSYVMRVFFFFRHTNKTQIYSVKYTFTVSSDFIRIFLHNNISLCYFQSSPFDQSVQFVNYIISLLLYSLFSFLILYFHCFPLFSFVFFVILYTSLCWQEHLWFILNSCTTISV